MEESYNFELNSRRLLWAWELTVSSLWLAYLFKCSARNLYHVNWGRNFIIITIATAGKFISKQLATWKFSRDGKNSRWYIHFNSFSFIPVLKCSINEWKAFCCCCFKDKMASSILFFFPNPSSFIRSKKECWKILVLSLYVKL